MCEKDHGLRGNEKTGNEETDRRKEEIHGTVEKRQKSSRARKPRERNLLAFSFKKRISASRYRSSSGTVCGFFHFLRLIKNRVILK